jgi:hypothetical protein
MSLGTDYLTFLGEGYFYAHPAVFFFTYPKIRIIIIIIPTFTEKEILNMKNQYIFFQISIQFLIENGSRVKDPRKDHTLCHYYFLVFFFL